MSPPSTMWFCAPTSSTAWGTPASSRPPCSSGGR
jgi:hypothetical protein